MTLPSTPEAQVSWLRGGACRDPHALLGAHPLRPGRKRGVVVRAWLPGARAVVARARKTTVPLQPVGDGLFEGTFSTATLPLAYRLLVTDAQGVAHEVEDPYRFLPTLGELDLHLFNEGRHLRLWEKLGAHPRVVDGVEGTAFAVWAPTAQRVAVIGTFNGWDEGRHPMRVLGASGVFELFLPGVAPGALYKFAILTAAGESIVKTDPYAQMMEQAPGHASIVVAEPAHAWQDGPWLARRAEADPLAAPMLVYEAHLPSWRRGEEGRVLSYREVAPLLAAHVARLGFTHVELMAVLEHPYGGSWGYQVGGYFAPTSRHGTPDDFRFLVDTLHEAGVGVLLDWVPAHFPKDAWALRRFDGTACYEHHDPRLGDHPEWGTHIFNYARHEVRNFLVANALYWIEAFHIDGLRVDAVASMLYLDYGREPGQWLRNRLGGRENLDAVAFLRQLNQAVRSLHPGVVMVAEESTAWPGVTAPVEEGGLGFTLKWNMGWMHDTLEFFRVDPLFRRGVHDRLTFAMMYEYSERFCNPLSHDEVVHLKRSLLGKMPGDRWQRFANLRALLAYMVTRPGKALLFMGTELAPEGEWNHEQALPWALLEDPLHRGVHDCLAQLGALYRAHPCLWRRDHDPSGHAWIVVDDRAHSVLAFARHDGAAHLVVVANLTPVPRPGYRLGVPASGGYAVRLNTDAPAFGGSGYAVPARLAVEPEPQHGFTQSVVATLPPLSVLVLEPVPDGGAG
jgi:1,4-alpha-glucan branching enzyme